jgi:hypothetical protein
MSKLLDAAATLIGWINHSATDEDEQTIAPNTTVMLSTPLDAADVFTFAASHPGHTAAVTFTLSVAPLRKDGTMGSWVQAAQVAIPAAGGRVEAPINGQLLTVAAGDAANVDDYCLVYARCQTTVPAVPPENPPVPAVVTGAYAGLTF